MVCFCAVKTPYSPKNISKLVLTMENDKADLIPKVIVKDGGVEGINNDLQNQESLKFRRQNASPSFPSNYDPKSSPMHTVPRHRNQGLGAPASIVVNTGSSSPATSTPQRRSPAFISIDNPRLAAGNVSLKSFPPGSSVESGAIQCLGCASAAAMSMNMPTLDTLMSKGSMGSRPRADSDYYGSANVNIGDKSLPGEMRGYNIKQSQQLPFCLWFMLAKSLGIKLHQKDRPWFGTIIYTLTLTFALVFAASNTWFLVYDIISLTTRQTVLTGAVEMLIVIAWSSLGVYANGLAFKLFTNKSMIQSVRMHSKTIFKINSAGLMAILGVIFIILNNYSNYEEFFQHTCARLGVNEWVCHLKFTSRVGHSIFALVWNLLVGVVVLSVCRTHTIGIRRFIKDLEEDGMMYIEYTREVIHHGHSRIDDILHNFDTDAFPDESDDWEEMSHMEMSTTPSEHSTPQRDNPPVVSPIRRKSSLKPRPSHLQGLDNPPEIKILDATDHLIGSPGMMQTDAASMDTNPSNVNLIIPDPPSQISQGSSNHESAIASMKVELGSPRQMPSPDSTDFNMSMEQEQFAMMPNCFTTEDILLSYWKISCRLRTTSRVMQRWLASWITFVILWSLTFIIYWLNHAATFIGIAEFVIPLLILPLVCSAYAEVNFEGQRMLRCICPMENRIRMLYYMNLQPLRMTVFGFSVNYSALLKVFSALILAFASRIILDEINK